MSARDVQTDIATQLSPQVGAPIMAMCPNDLPGKVGATIVCTFPLGGQTVHVTARVTEVKGREVAYDVSTRDVPAR